VKFEAEGLSQRAEREYRAVLEIAPRDIAALMRLGLLLAARGEFAKAAPLFRRASFADPRDPISRMNLGAALLKAGDDAGAGEAYAQALNLDPRSYEARLNLAFCLLNAGRFEEARVHYAWLADRDPRDGLARWNVAALDGLAGDLEAAFAGFALPHPMRSTDVPLHLPRWGGEPLAGRTLALWADQGLGDTIMFARLPPLTRQAGGRVVLHAQAELVPLLSRADLADACVPVSRGERAASVPADVWYPLPELPALLGAARSLAAASGPYLTVDPARAALWAARLPDTSRPRVGVVWAGSGGHAQDHRRSIALKTLLPALSSVKGVELVSLQKGPPAGQADGTALVRADLDIADFEDTAAALARLDLVISVDTSVLHLAGALGRPVWGLVAHSPDWRWMLGRDDSPWYPTLRLFRQPGPGDWRAVAGNVAAALTREFAPPAQA
jgi:tetratricopeptide (TPR) repeat protein